MFQNLNFWQKWSASSRTLYQIGLFLLTISLMLLGFAYFKGLENVVQWNILSELADASFKLDEFNANGLPFAIPAKAYYVTEQFIASPMHINLWASEAYVLLCAIGFGLIASASTALPRISYLVVMIILIFAIMTMQWDLFLNHSGNLTAGILITLFGILSYYFHAFGTEIAILKRFFSFTALISTFVVVVWLLSKQPFDVLLMHLAAYRLPMALLLSVGFIFWVSFEILNGFLYVSTNAGSSQSLLNFSVMSFFYLGNVLLVWLKNASIIDWDIVYLSPFLLLAVSTILGLWGFRKRRHLVAQEMPFQISGAYIYVGLAIITLATAFFSFATANDPLQEFLEDAITYSHLVMGFFFYCYVFTNFFALFVQKLDVSKVVFKPLRLPLYVFRIITVIVIATLLALKGYFTINQGFAGYYATLGDLSTFKKEYQFAEIQYKQALQYEFRNHKTNYALASLALIQGDNATAGVYFRQAVQKVPSPFAYSGLSRSLMQENQFFQSMFILKEGLEKFPKSGELQHNLAYLFEKSNLPDSAQFYYQKAVKNASQSEVSAANILALNVKNGTLPNQVEEQKYISQKANTLAIMLLKNLKPNDFELNLHVDSVLSVSEFAYLSNYVFTQKEKGKNLINLIEKLEQNPNNEQFINELQYARASQNYFLDDKLKALEMAQNRMNADSTTKDNPFRLAYLAWLAKEQNFAEAMVKRSPFTTMAEYENALKHSPLNLQLIGQFTAFCNQQKQDRKGYDYVLRVKEYLPQSAKLQALYVQQCLAINMYDYAQTGMTQLQIMDEKAYFELLPAFEEKIKAAEKKAERFQ